MPAQRMPPRTCKSSLASDNRVNRLGSSRHSQVRPDVSTGLRRLCRRSPRLTAHTEIVAIVVTYESAGALAPVIASLRPRPRVAGSGRSSQTTVPRTTPADRAYEPPDLVVIDNSPYLGHVGGISAAMAVAGEAEAFLIRNPDLQVGRRCLQRLILWMQKVGTGIECSLGSTGDSYASAIAESFRLKGPRMILDDVDYATLYWVD